MAERNFDAEYPVEVETHTFTFGGQQFHIAGNLHPALFLDRTTGVQSLVDFVCGCLVSDEERKVFLAIVADINSKVTTDQLNDIVSWIFEVTSDRPTTAPDSSGATVASVS